MAEINDMGSTPVDNLTQAFLDNEATEANWWSNENAKLRKEVERLTAQLTAARVAVEKWRFRECCAGCGEGGNENAQCYTDAVENDAARTEARHAVGLEESHG